MSNPIRIDEWFTVPLGNGFTAPEIAGIGVAGIIAPGAHPRKTDGGKIKTSRVASIANRVVTTASGTRYRLGRIDRGFRKWMRKEGIIFDWRNPISIGKRLPRVPQ